MEYDNNKKLIDSTIELYNFIHGTNFDRESLLRIVSVRNGLINSSIDNELFYVGNKSKKLRNGKTLVKCKYRGDF